MNKASLILQSQQKMMQQKQSPTLGCLPHKYLLQALYSASSRMLPPFPVFNTWFTATVLSTQNVLFGFNKCKRKCPSLHRNPNTGWNHSLFSTGLPLWALPAVLPFWSDLGTGGLKQWPLPLPEDASNKDLEIISHDLKIYQYGSLNQVMLCQMWNSDILTHGLFANCA